MSRQKRGRVKELMDFSLSELEMDVRLHLIPELIPLGLMHVGNVLKEERRIK